MQKPEPRIHLPKAVLFDMDGTLTQPLLDFATIHREMNIGEQPILEALALLDVAERKIALEVLLRHEDAAAANSMLNPGCRELLSWLDARGTKSAIVTRNSLQSTQTIVQRHALPFDVLVTRDDGSFKPDPTPLFLGCERLSTAPADAWMVGDGKYDVQAGLAAGMRTVWLSHGQQPDFEERPWRTVRDLLELTKLLQSCLAE